MDLFREIVNCVGAKLEEEDHWGPALRFLVRPYLLSYLNFLSFKDVR